LLLASATAADTAIVLRGDALPGKRARIGGNGPVGVIVEEAGLSVPFDRPPGRYRIEAALRSNGRGDALRRRLISMSISGTTASATLEALDQGAILRVDIVHHGPSAEARFTLGRLTKAMETERRVLEADDAGMGKASKRNLTPAKFGAEPDDDLLAELETGAAADAAGLDDDPLTELETGAVADVASRKMPVIILEWIRIVPRSGPVIVRQLSSDRITYAPGSEGKLTVELQNLSAVEQAVALSVDMLTGLAERQSLATEFLTLPPGGKVTKQVGFAIGQALWGRGFEAIAAAAKGKDLASHAVSVVTNPWMVAMHGRGVPMFGSEQWTAGQAQLEAERLARENLENYCNVYEKFAWAACDYSEMTPENDDTIYSGQTQYTSKRSAYQILHNVFTQHGIAAITYGKACGGGLAGLEYSHAHPERMNIFGHAGFAHESFDVDIIDRMREGRYRIHGRDEDFWQMWISCWTHFGNHGATFYGCDEIAASAKMLGWNGVRYDGEWLVWNNPVLSASLVKVTEDYIRKQVPGFAFGYNTIGPRYAERAGAFTDVGVAAKARGGGMCMDEYYRNLSGPAKNNITHLQNAGDFIRLHGGYYLCIFDDNTPWNMALIMAAGARPMGGQGHRDLRKFATRYSQFIFDPGLRRLVNPGLFIKPVKDLPFRWDAFVYERICSPRKTQLILQMVNVADSTTFGSQTNPPANLNPPQQDIMFDLTLPPGYRPIGVFAAGNMDNLQPMQASLEGFRLAVPELDVWTMAIIELEREENAPALSELSPEPELVFDKIYGDGTPTPRAEGAVAEVKIAGPIDAAAVKAINDCRVRITPEVLDKVLALGLPPDTAPGDELYDAISFDDHCGGRDARWDNAPAPPLSLNRDGRPDILHGRGGFAHRHRLEEAFAWISGAEVADSAVRDATALADLAADNPGCLEAWPERAELSWQDVVVLDAVPAPALSLAQRRDLRDFVAAGGGLFALGSWYSLSKGEYEGSFIEEALPVRCRQAAYLRRLRPEDGMLQVTPAYQRVLGVAPPSLPAAQAIEWVCHIEPRPGAEVLMTTSKGIPVLVAGAFGSGRSLVWAASASGLPDAPWWESTWWPEVAVSCLRYLARGAEAVSPPCETLTKRLAEARNMVEDASMQALTDGELGKQSNAEAAAEVVACLRTLLCDGGKTDARLAVAYLLENSACIDPCFYPE